MSRQGEKLYAQPTMETAFELLPISDTGFIRLDEDVRYTLVRGEDGKVGAVRLRFPGGGVEAGRLAEGVKVPAEQLMTGNVAEAMEGYRRIRKEKPNNASVAEDRLNGLDYSLLRQNKLVEAIAVFKVNTELYPQSANVYDSLGEAYMMHGDKELAISNYKKSLELDPHNQNAMQMLGKLNQP